MPTPSLTLYFIRLSQLTPADHAMLLNCITDADRLELASKATPERTLQRALRRYLLAHFLNTPTQALTFSRDTHGKPALAHQAIEFGISHTTDAFALVIGCETGKVGVDIESAKRQMPRERLARRYYSLKEQEALNAASHPDHCFLEIWTRKEAVVKAHGLGLRIKIASLETTNPSIKHDQLGMWQIDTHTANDHVISVAWEYAQTPININRVYTLPSLSNTLYN